MENIIETLKVKKIALTVSLSSCVDEKSYDLIQDEIAQISKTILLEENRQRIRIAKEEARIRKEAISDHNSRLKKVEQLKTDAIRMDSELFEKIHQVYDAYSSRYDLALQIADEVKLLQESASSLGLEVPPSEMLKICSIENNWWGKEKFLPQIIAQYNLAHLALQVARKNYPRDLNLKEKKIPDRPGLDWYAKGGGLYPPEFNDPQEA